MRRNAALNSQSSHANDTANSVSRPDNRIDSTLDGGLASGGFQTESSFEVEQRVIHPPKPLQIAPISRIERWFQYRNTGPRSDSEIILKPVD